MNWSIFSATAMFFFSKNSAVLPAQTQCSSVRQVPLVLPNYYTEMSAQMQGLRSWKPVSVVP